MLIGLKLIYKLATGDQAKETHVKSANFELRMKALLDMEDYEMIKDWKVLGMNPQNTAYDIFWDEMAKYLEEASTAVDDRRHGTVEHMSRAISVEVLKREVAARLPDKTPVPSTRWIRYQFYPKDPTTAQAMNYTGRFKMRMQVQTRLIRKDHVDKRYGAKSWKDMKRLAVHLRGWARLVCQDDKAKIPVGEPHTPIAATSSNRGTLQQMGRIHAAADHDFHKFNLTPSVSLIVDVPESIEESFHTGKVYVTLKDSIFEGSSPFRHGAELMNALKHSGALEDPNFAVLLKYHDGGSDHNDTNPSVICGNICEFLVTGERPLCFAVNSEIVVD